MTNEEKGYYSKRGILIVNSGKTAKDVKRDLLIPILATNEKDRFMELHWYDTDGVLQVFPLVRQTDEFMEKINKTYFENPEREPLDAKLFYFGVLYIGKAGDWQMPEDENEKYVEMNRCLKGYAQNDPEQWIVYAAAAILRQGAEKRGVRRVIPLSADKGPGPRPYSIVDEKWPTIERHWRLHREPIF